MMVIIITIIILTATTAIINVVCMSPLHSFCNNLHLAYNTFAHSNLLCQDYTAFSNFYVNFYVLELAVLRLVFLVVGY